MTTSNPEYHGYKLGENIAPYINKCIETAGECYLSEGTHLVGRNDQNWKDGNIWTDNAIVWGWIKTDNVKIIGKGIDKTILKLIDNVQSRYLNGNFAESVFLLTTNYNVNCNNTIIEGITWDGNYSNNNTTSTINCIRIRGENTKINNCKFINFGVGNSLKAECFQIVAGPVSAGKGPSITNNVFESVGNKSNTKDGFVPENTFIAAGGNDVIIDNNSFNNCIFDVFKQQSPLHAISLSNSFNARITNNKFTNFQGCCVYVDSWKNENVVISNNSATNVWQFLQLSCQKWNNPEQISFSKNFSVEKNTIVLSNDHVFFQWDKPELTSCFIGYSYDPAIDYLLYMGFENVVVKNNKITLGNTLISGKIVESDRLKCYYGAIVPVFKINVDNTNSFISTLPKQEKKSFFQKIIGFFTNLFN